MENSWLEIEPWDFHFAVFRGHGLLFMGIFIKVQLIVTDCNRMAVAECNICKEIAGKKGGKNMYTYQTVRGMAQPCDSAETGSSWLYSEIEHNENLFVHVHQMEELHCNRWTEWCLHLSWSCQVLASVSGYVIWVDAKDEGEVCPWSTKAFCRRCI